MSRIIHDCPQRSAEWFAVRAGLLTASVAGDILATRKDGKESAARRDLRVRLALERVTGESQERAFDNSDLQRGRELESEALAAYEGRSGHLMSGVGFVSRDDLPIGCSPDGALVVSGRDMKNDRPLPDEFRGGVDVKCPRPANHLAYLKNPSALVADYEAQMCHTLLVTDAPWWDLASYCPQFRSLGLDLLIVRCLRAGQPPACFDGGALNRAQAVDVAAYELLARQFLREVESEVQSIRQMAGQEAA